MNDADSNGSEQVLDVKGLNCPMPVLRAKVALSRMQPGERLRVLATDPYSVMDFEAFCQNTGHTLLNSERDGDTFVFVLRRRREPSEQPDRDPPG